MGNCLIVNHMCFPCLSSRQVRNFNCVTQWVSRGRGGVVGKLRSRPVSVAVCREIIDDYANGGWFFSLGVGTTLGNHPT